MPSDRASSLRIATYGAGPSPAISRVACARQCRSSANARNNPSTFFFGSRRERKAAFGGLREWGSHEAKPPGLPALTPRHRVE